MKKNKLMVLFMTLLFPLIEFFNINCLSLINNDDEPYTVSLLPKDSSAVWHILNDNGFDSINVYAFVSGSLVYSGGISYLYGINLNSQSLKKFIFSKYFDSLSNGISLNLMNNTIDTLIFTDSIYHSLDIRLDYNILKNIPDDIVKLKSNIALDISHNQLTSISSNIMNCNVESIYVDSNYLCNVSDTMKQWLNTKSGSTAWQSRQTCH
jgi:hypothetical protein